MNVIAVIALVSAAAACGGDDDDQSDDTSIVALLHQLPTVGEDADLDITYGNVVAASAAGGVARPDDPRDTDALVPWIKAMNLVAARFPQASNPSRMNELGPFVDEVGWSLLDIDAFVEYQRVPESFAVIAGDIDEAQIDDAVGEATDGVWSLGEGDDGASNPDEVSPARPLGRPVRMSLRDGLLLVTGSTASATAWHSGLDQSMADNPTLLAVAEHLDDAGVYAAHLVTSDGEGGYTYDTYGVGVSGDSTSPVGTFVYHYADDAMAKAAVPALRGQLVGKSDVTGEPWSKLFASWEVQSDGEFVIVEVHMAPEVTANAIWEIVLAHDSAMPN